MFFFKDTATPELYTLSLHGALPISVTSSSPSGAPAPADRTWVRLATPLVAVSGGVVLLSVAVSYLAYRPQLADPTSEPIADRKSTRLNSSHANISYAVFCLKKKYNI